jgi:hypothetical protein
LEGQEGVSFSEETKNLPDPMKCAAKAVKAAADYKLYLQYHFSYPDTGSPQYWSGPIPSGVKDLN